MCATVVFASKILFFGFPKCILSFKNISQNWILIFFKFKHYNLEKDPLYKKLLLLCFIVLLFLIYSIIKCVAGFLLNYSKIMFISNLCDYDLDKFSCQKRQINFELILPIYVGIHVK